MPLLSWHPWQMLRHPYSTRMPRILLAAFLLPAILRAQGGQGGHEKFRQLGPELPTASELRTASGAPGKGYWQNRVDYDIDVTLDDATQQLSGRERITYRNASPDTLRFLWVQLDQNLFTPNSIGNLTRTGRLGDGTRASAVTSLTGSDTTGEWFGGYRIRTVTTDAGATLPTAINGTMMRVDLDRPLAPGATRVIRISWDYRMLATVVSSAQGNPRSGWERFARDGNRVYNVAQWFPRLAVYNDDSGWQTKQFIGGGEFTLPFGNYTVNVTVPADHIVAATGTLSNALVVLTPAQRTRLAQALAGDSIRHIITPDEARANESSHSGATRRWTFRADNVRDFAWASSRKFIWDARGVAINGRRVLAQSYYPGEANPLWGEYSTRAVAHALESYSKRTIPYPYPQATSVHWNGAGMEYPMICFNPRRPNADGSYDDATKFGLISVVIHEVGHNFFPMIINSDERQWAWMDEGLNSFTQFLSEQEWSSSYPSRRGPAKNVIDYMKLEKAQQEPIMTNSESIVSLGSNAYLKTATALNILRNTVMGPALFDAAFREYARRWAFKQPTPADFFRTMEDVSAVDLDWFWRGWFYGVDHVDLALRGVREFKRDATGVIADSSADRERASRFIAGLGDDGTRALGAAPYLYEVDIENVGGLVMPVLLTFVHEEGTTRKVRIPAEIWRVNAQRATKAFASDRKVKEILLDVNEETADLDSANNAWPPRPGQTPLQRFRARTVVP
jgi:hypothetical protein